MSSDYCSETSFYANAKSIVGSIKLFIAKYFYGEFSELNVISRSLFVVVRFITRNIKLSIKKILLATPQPWREKRGETHFPFFVEWAVPRCVVHQSIAGAGSLRARTLHYRNVEGMAAIACKNPSHVATSSLCSPFINYRSIDERRRVLRARVFYFRSLNCLAFHVKVLRSSGQSESEKSCCEVLKKTLSCLQPGAVWSERKIRRKVSIRKKKVAKSKSDQEEKWK